MSEAALEEPAVIDPANVPADPAPETAPVAAAPPYDPTEDPRVVDFVNTQAARIAEERFQHLVEEAQRGAQQQPALTTDGLVDEYGNINPAALAEFLAQRDERLFGQIDQRFQQIAQPLEARAQAETIQEGEQRIQDMIADDVSRNGDFPVDPDTGKSPAKELIRPLADLLFNDVAATYGATPRAAEIAVSKAATLVREIVDLGRKTGVTEHINRNAELAGANRQPGAGAVGLTTRPEGPRKPGELARQFGQSADRIRYGAGT